MNKADDKKSSASWSVFAFGWAALLISTTILMSSELRYIFDVTTIFRVIKLFVTAVFLFKICFIDKHSITRIVVSLLVTCITYANSIITGRNELFFATLVIMSTKNIPLEKFIRFDLIIRVALILTIISLSAIGIIPNYTSVINGSYKQALGFLHPNGLCFYILTALLELMVLKKRKITKKYILINIVTLLFVYLVCFSRTGVLMYLAIIAVDFFTIKKRNIFTHKITKTLLTILPILLTLMSFFMVIEYGNGNRTMQTIDDITTTRISNGYKYYDEYGINLFGSKIETIGTRKALLEKKQSSILDMGYLRLAIENGIVVLCIVVAVLSFQIKRLIELKQYELLLALTFFVLIGLMETTMYSISFNFALVSFLSIISMKKNRRNDIKTAIKTDRGD